MFIAIARKPSNKNLRPTKVTFYPNWPPTSVRRPVPSGLRVTNLRLSTTGMDQGWGNTGLPDCDGFGGHKTENTSF